MTGGMYSGGSLTESKHALALAREKNAFLDDQSPILYSTVGVHPTRCGEFDNNELGLDADAYYAELERVCLDGKKDGTVRLSEDCGEIVLLPIPNI
jgi:hypothetical protein